MDRKLILFITSKYIEFTLFFLATIFFANSIGNISYGEHAIVFTTISYAPFFLLGTNQLTLRSITILHDKGMVIHQSFLIFTLLLIIAICFSFFSADRLHILVLMVVFLKLFNEFLLTIARGLLNYNLLSYCYLSSALVWLIYLFFLDKNIFFFVWPIALFFPLLIIIFNYKLFLIKPIKKNLFNFSEIFIWIRKSYKYAIIGFYLPVLTTLDRWFIDSEKFGSDLGLIQFSYNFSNIVSFGLGAFSFYFYPIFLQKINDKKIKYTSLNYKFFKIELFVFLLTFIFLYLFQNFDMGNIGFEEYNGISKYLWIYFPVRILIWSFFPFNILVDVLDKHSFYVKIVVFMLVFQYISYHTLSLFDDSYVLKYHSIIQLLSVLIFSIIIKFSVNRWL